MVYADYAAGAPLRPEADAAMRAAFAEGALNPSSPHWAGARARAILEDARETVAAAIGARPLEVVFTSGATEANNLAIAGSAVLGDGVVAALASDHSSVLEPLRALAARGAPTALLCVDEQGRADRQAIIALRPAFLSFALVNAETGAMQDAAELTDVVHACGGRVHVDAAQVGGLSSLDVAGIGADLVTLSGHKVGGPPGTGALVVAHRPSVRVTSILHGGPQERGLRPGTENVPAIAGFAAALACAMRRDEHTSLGSWCADLADTLTTLHPRARVASPRWRAPHILNVTLPGMRAESIVTALDLEGVGVSAGSACAAGASEPSHVLLAMGWTRADAESAVRVSLGWATTKEDVRRIREAFTLVIGRALGDAHVPRALEVTP
jgi:cysteine desulfurase